MSFNKYRIIDMLLFGVIGIVTETLALYVEVSFIPCIPIFVVALVFIEVMMVRWGWLGLIYVPVFAITNFLVGKFFLPNSVNGNYTWQTIVENLVSFSACSLTYVWFYKKDAFKLLKNIPFLIIYSVSIHLVFVLLDGSMVTILRGGQYFNNLLDSLVYTLVGLVLGPMLLFILQSQGVVKNMKKSFLDQKREMEEERVYQANLEKNVCIEEKETDEEKDGV